MSNINFDVYSFNLKDKFGDYGITGVAIINSLKIEIAEIDSFLMSCRVIGRKIELAFIDFIINSLKTRSISKINSRYIVTTKNDQVKNFFENVGFRPIKKNKNGKSLQLDLSNYKSQKVPFIKIKI